MRNKYISMVISVIAAMAAVVVAVSAGDPGDPPGPPESTDSYTLEQIYQRLATGASDTPITFTEPVSGPGTGTMHTLNEIMAIAPEVDNPDGATQADIAAGATAWGLTSGEWGLITGTMYGGCTCSGTLHGTRWCDNHDGTVTDLTTCFHWVQTASCTGTIGTVDNSTGELNWYDASFWTSYLGGTGCGLSDGSGHGDWMLPSIQQLLSLRNGPEAVTPSSMRAFTNVMPAHYWSSTTIYAEPPTTTMAYGINMVSGLQGNGFKQTDIAYVWPIRIEP